MITRKLIIVGFLMSLTACGGGGSDGGSSDASQPTPVADTPTPTPPTSDNTDTSTDTSDDVSDTSAADIDVPVGFDFSTSKSFGIQVNLAGDFPSKMYLTVCRNLPSDAAASGSDFEKCLARTPVIDGAYQGEIQLPNDVDTLTATLWSFDPAGVVRTVEWDRQTDGASDLLIAE